MDTELERLRLEIARVKKDRDQILKERNQYLSQVQHERTSKAELSSKNTEMSNQLLARDSEINDLKRTNRDLSEQLELALSVKVEGDRKPTLSRTSTLSPLRATPVKARSIPRSSVSVEVPIRPKSSLSRTAAARENAIVVSDDEEAASVEPKAEASSPIRGEQPAGEDIPPGPSGLEASDNDDPFAGDFEFLQKDQTLSPRAEEQGERSLSPLSIISSPPSSRATTELTDLPASSDLSNLKDDEMDVDTTKPESSKSGLKRKREEEPEITSTPKKKSIEKGSPSKVRTRAKGGVIKKIAPLTKLYLSNIPHFAVTPSPESGLFFSREDFSHCRGGSTQWLIVNLKDWKPSSLSGRPIKCIWPGKVQNPLTVDGIGAPGLMFASRPDILSDPPLYMFRNVEIDGRSQYEYCGNYEATTVGRLEAEHFKMCSKTAHTKWTKKIANCKNKDYLPYVSMRVRIALRKMGEAITPERVKREAQLLIDGGKGKGMDITSKDVLNAFFNGDEHLDIVLMRCVGYDHEFVRDLKRDITVYDAEGTPRKKQRVSGKGKQKQQQSTSPSPSPPPPAATASGPRRSKREKKPRKMIDDDYDDDDDNDDED